MPTACTNASPAGANSSTAGAIADQSPPKRAGVSHDINDSDQRSADSRRIHTLTPTGTGDYHDAHRSGAGDTYPRPSATG